MPSGLVAAASYSPAYHSDSGADCWLTDPYGLNVNQVRINAINATGAFDWQTVGWVPALYKQGANGAWNFVLWGTWTTYSASESGGGNVVVGGGGQGFSIPRSMPGNYRVAILYRWFVRPEIRLAQQDRFEWLTGPYHANGGVALYPYCLYSQGTIIIGGG